MQSPKKRGKHRKMTQNSLSRIPARLSVLMGIVVLMLGALGWRLVSLQITNSENYKSAVTNAESSIEKVNVQRGSIYDSTGKVLATNTGSQAITYTKPRAITELEMYQIANNVGKYVTVDTKTLSDANYASYYIDDERRAQRVAKASGTTAAPGTDDYVAAIKDYVQTHMTDFPLTDRQLNKAMIYQKMANAYALSTVYIKEADVTQDEIANIGERQSKMPGVSVGIYYKRNYPEGDGITSLIGGTSKSGLPESEVNQLIAKGYSRDDVVGVSYLEKQYETALSGTKSTVKVTTDKNGRTTQKTIYKGKAGSNLKLTINAKFQNDVQDILEKQIPGGYTSGAYAVVMNPKTGGIYATAGVNRDIKTGELTPDALSTVNRANVVGSVVKPAMITTGFMNNVITPDNNTLVDQPIKVAGTASKSSWWNRDGSGNMPITADQALMMSSNTYVMQVMLKIGGLNYTPNMSLANLPSSVYQTMRDGFARFGLGVKTGVDLPGEITGLKGSTTRDHIGNALDESFGQYDTYTTMQLAQYVSTIANGGYRIQPHIVDAITSQDGKQSMTIPTKVLGTVGWSQAERDLIWKGMNEVVHSSSGYATGTGLKAVKPDANAKTGTAETVYVDGDKEIQTITSSLISFVPGGDVAMAIVVPGTDVGDENVNQHIAVDIYDAFWKDVQDAKTNVK